MKKLFYFLLAVIFFSLSACSPNTPQGIVKTYLTNLKNEDYEKALMSFNFYDSIQADEKAIISETLKNIISSKNGISKFRIKDMKKNEDKTTGTLTAVIYYGNNTNEELSFEVVKIEGKWKIKAK